MKRLVLALILSTSAASLAQTGDGGPGGGGPTAQAPRDRHKATRTDPGYVTFIGFQKMGDSARVFVRTTSPVTPSQMVLGESLVVTLPGFRLDRLNNGRPLDTRYFGTNVVRVRAVEVKGKGVEVHVSFAKGAMQAKVSSAQSPPEDPDGGPYLYLDF